MQTSVNLQDPFTYSIVPFIIITFLILVMTYYIFHLMKKKEKQVKENSVEVIPEKNIKNIPVIKGKYIEQLDIIEHKYRSETIDLRKAYQLISEAVRMFVFEITDITTQNYSLREIKNLNIPNLYELIKEYYEPEFASKSVGDFETSINKARGVIKEWN